VIRELGLLNEDVYEHHAAYGVPKRDHHWGVPYPGVFLLDEQGCVMQKRFQPLTFIHDAGDAMVQVLVRYQACSDELGCLMPKTVTLQVPVQVQDHIDRPRQR